MLLLVALGGAPLGATELAALVPAGPRVTLEVPDVAAVSRDLDQETGRVHRLLESEGRQRFAVSKIALKLGSTLSTRWIEPLFGDLGLGGLARKLLGQRALLAVYDLEKLHFLYGVESRAAGQLQELLDLAQAPRTEVRLGERPAHLVGPEGQGLFLWEEGGRIWLSNHEPLARKAASRGGEVLAAQEDYQEVTGGLPPGLARIFLPASTFDTVYMGNYWVGGKAARPPREAVGACLEAVPGEPGVYRERRRRQAGELTALTPDDPLLGLLPTGLFREVATRSASPSGDDLAAHLGDLLLPPARTDRARRAREAFDQIFTPWVEACRSYGVSGRVLRRGAAPFRLGPAPERAFAPASEGPSHLREELVVALSFAGDAGPRAQEVSRALTDFRTGYLHLSPEDLEGQPSDSLPLFADLSWKVTRQDGVVLIRRGAEALPPPERALPAVGPGSVPLARRVEVDGARLESLYRDLGEISRARSSWLDRSRGDFARVQLQGLLEGPLRGLGRLELVTWSHSGIVEDELRIELGR